jgi:hypothetical protein
MRVIRVHPAHFLSRLMLGAVVSVTLLATGAPVRALEEIDAFRYDHILGSDGVAVAGCDGTCPIDLVIPSTLDGLPVLEIGFRAFEYSMLASVTIPDGVTSIGGYAFRGNQLTSVTIPSSVTSIGPNAFYGNQLTSVTIPNGVTNISVGAFSRNQLTSVTIPDGVTSIGTMAFGYNQLTSVTIPYGVTSIGSSAFLNNLLTNIEIPNSVTVIEQFAFGANRLTSVTIPSSITAIEQAAFAWNQLTSVSLGNSVTTIGEAAFADNLLTSITIPASVTSIGDYAFTMGELITIVFEGDAPTASPDVFTSSADLGPTSSQSRAFVAPMQGRRGVLSVTSGQDLSLKRVWRQPAARGWSSTWGGVKVATIGASAIATVKPSLRGTTMVGKILTAANGTWTGYPTPTIRYQWYACTTAVTAARSTVPSTCKKITGATRSTFKLTSAQRAKYVTVFVTGTSTGTTPTTWLAKTTTKIK